MSVRRAVPRAVLGPTGRGCCTAAPNARLEFSTWALPAAATRSLRKAALHRLDAASLGPVVSRWRWVLSCVLLLTPHLGRPALTPPLPQSDERLALLVEFFDAQASLARRYQLLYYTADDTIEMVSRPTQPLLLSCARFLLARPRHSGHSTLNLPCFTSHAMPIYSTTSRTARCS